MFRIDRAALEAVKADHVRQLTKVGMPRADAQEVVDLAAHAVDEALTALDRVCDGAPDADTQLTALRIAAAWLAENTEGLIKGLDDFVIRRALRFTKGVDRHK